jgi:hypothetical protein
MNASAHDGGKTVEFQDLAWLAAEATFAENGGDITPRFIAENTAGEVHEIVTPWRDNSEKPAYLSAVRDYFVKHKIIRYAVLSEIWLTQKRIDTKAEAKHLMADGASDILPSQDPARVSALMVQTVDAFGVGICFIKIIEEGEPRRLAGERIEMDNAKGSMLGGRMASLLQPPGWAARMHS